MKYRHLFFDLDHTLWDFDANARVTLESLYEELQLKERGVHDFELFYRNYLVHNDKLWERYRKGFIRQDELRVKRMWLALLDFKIADDELSKAMSILFLEKLPTRTILFPHTKEILQYLKDKSYQLHLITNGFEKVQHSKLKYSGLDTFFEEVITSEGSNSLKPNKEIFDYALQKTGATINNSIMLGDTLDADIQGAINAGMDQVFVNHLGITEMEIKPTYVVNSLKELEQIF
ncbi:MAG: noncanonical pyrimidine nucleotidase, YjjG family [Chitinophagaceae bacterium]|jgi:putative hydrolase of the HAD superfamily|nr:MAG: noncanonical pyrimidine nucleotidase, YjjG family [Chitinophagaceae bacterium]